MMKGIFLASILASPASCWTPRRIQRILGKLGVERVDRVVEPIPAPGWTKVPIPTLDDLAPAREVELTDLEILHLHETSKALPESSQQIVPDTHIVVVPNVDQDFQLFDPMLGALGVMGLHSVVATVSLQSWRQSIRYLTESVRVLRRAVKDAGRQGGPEGGASNSWENLYDEDMLSRALFPVFTDLAGASEDASLPSCKRLVLVGCEDSAWVLHAFLCELDRMRMKPQIPVTLVALGLSSESLLSKAIMKVHPGKLAGVKYLSIHGEVPNRVDGASRNAIASPLSTSDLPDAADQGGVESEYSSGRDSYNYDAPSRELQAMTCMAVDGVNEECIFSPSGWDGPMGPWFADPTTIASWIGKCL
jgi:hypothetical protein